MRVIQVITVFLIIIVVVVAVLFSSEEFLGVLKNIQGSLQSSLQSSFRVQEETTQEESQEAKPTIRSVGSASVVLGESKSTILVDTYIISGPEEGEIIEDTNKVTFEFEAKIFPKGTDGRISFETKIQGFDDDWKKTFSKKRIINLPPGPKEYTFLVRAKIKNLIDPTPAKRIFKIKTSPYFGKIKISGVRAKGYNYPSLIRLRSRLGKEEKINITNWRIRGYKGEIIIPRGIEKYRSDVTPRDIIIRPGNNLYLLGASSPLGINRNFRLNKCFGYFLNDYKFFPSFSKNCPKPRLEEISYFTPYCQEFILRLSRCEIPDYSQNLRITLDSECTSYIGDNFNYNSCFRNYSKDEDFLKNYWYIYLGRDIVNKLHDTLYLLDQNGLVVDKYLY